MNCKSLKDCSDDEIVEIVQKAIHRIRGTPDKYGVIKIEMAGGKVKFITVETPFEKDS